MNAKVHRSRRARARLGFTLLELMVAGTAGAIAVSSMFFISSASTNYFREQQRISNMQSSLRYAMDQIRRDVARAGFGATPSHAFYTQSCGPNTGIPGPGGAARFQAIGVVNASAPAALIDPAGGHLIDGVPLEGDTLNLLGNYATPSEYAVAGYLKAGGAQVELSNEFMSFTRDFTAWVNGPPYNVDPTLFNGAFLPGRLVRYKVGSDRWFSTVAATTLNPPTVTFGTALPNVLPCTGGSATVNPVSMIQYAIAAAGAQTAHANPAVAGVNTQLVRSEIGYGTGGGVLAGTAPRIVAERVVHFNVDFLTNTLTNRTLTPQVAAAVGPNAAAAPPERIFSATVTLAVRGPQPDRSFRWVAQGVGEELARYRFNPVQTNATRVRIARAEIFLPNIAYEWVD